MDRILKFRAWNREGKRYVTDKESRYLFLGINKGDGVFESVSDYETSFDCTEDYIVEQFTGLRDKEGREIYENDVVKFSVFERFREMESEKIKVVKWVDGIPGGWSPFHLHTVVEDGFYNYEIESPQVIGNIHENPELLEVSK
jgi:uncharacterized phage protein (TIGR01671 family)